MSPISNRKSACIKLRPFLLKWHLISLFESPYRESRQVSLREPNNMTSSFQNYFLTSICAEDDEKMAKRSSSSAEQAMVRIVNPEPPEECTDELRESALGVAQDTPNASVRTSTLHHHISLRARSNRPLPKISLIEDHSLLHILVFLTHLEILKLRLIHPAFNHFISLPEVENYLCLKRHFVIDLNVYEKNINPSTPMFSLLHSLFPQMLPYYCLCEHYTECMFPTGYDEGPSFSRAHEHFMTFTGENTSEFHSVDQPQRASLIASVHDHFPEKDAKCPIILLKRRKDLHDSTQHVVQKNMRNALILNATGMSSDAIRSYFHDTEKRLYVLQLPKFKYNLKKYAKRLKQPDTCKVLHDALRCALRRTLYTRHEGAILYEDFQQLRESEWKKYHRKHRRVEQFQTRRAVMYWALMPVLMPVMGVSKHLGFRRGLAAALEDDRGKKPKRVRLREVAQQGIDKTRHQIDKTKEKMRDMKHLHGHLHTHPAGRVEDTPRQSEEMRHRPTNEAPYKIEQPSPEKHGMDMPANEVDRNMERMVAEREATE